MRQCVRQADSALAGRFAYAVSGSGPPLIQVQGWLSHLELGWALPEERHFHESLSQDQTLVRYDRPGCGLTGGQPAADVVAAELDLLDALVERVCDGPVAMFGSSFGAPLAALWAATRPARCSRLVLYGGWVEGRRLAPPQVQTHVLGLVEQHWGLGSSLLTDIFAPDAGSGLRDVVANYQRAAASAPVARRMLEAAYTIDVTDALPAVRARTTVLHREGDRAAPADQGRQLAAGIASAAFVRLPGRNHLPYVGDGAGVVAAVRAALGLPALGPMVVASEELSLTPRQLEVAALVAAGMPNREIAGRLVISERTAQSHVERIRLRLQFRSRAQIATWFTARYGAAAVTGAVFPRLPSGR